jgi:hypothetical protein
MCTTPVHTLDEASQPQYDGLHIVTGNVTTATTATVISRRDLISAEKILRHGFSEPAADVFIEETIRKLNDGKSSCPFIGVSMLLTAMRYFLKEY